MFDIDKMYVMIPYYNAVVTKEVPNILTGEIDNLIEEGNVNKSIVNISSYYKDLIDAGLDYDFKPLVEAMVEVKNGNEELASEVEKLSRNLANQILSSELIDSPAVTSFMKKHDITPTSLVYSYTPGTNAYYANNLIKYYKAILTHPDLMSTIGRPIDYTFLKQGIVKMTESLKDDQNASLYHFSPLEDVDLLFDFRNGKAGIGQEANAMVDLGRLSNLSINVSDKFLWGRQNDSVIDLDNKKSLNISEQDLSDYIEFLGLTKQGDIDLLKSEIIDVDVMSSMVAVLNAFVDIAKDPYITQGNWLTSTTNIGNTLLRMGVHPTYVMAYMAQPALKASSSIYRKENTRIKTHEYVWLNILKEANKEDENVIDVINTLLRPNSNMLVFKPSEVTFRGAKATNKLESSTFKKTEEYFTGIYETVANLPTETITLYSALSKLNMEHENSEVVAELMRTALMSDLNQTEDVTAISIFREMLSNEVAKEDGLIDKRTVGYVNHLLDKSKTDLGGGSRNIRDAIKSYVELNPNNVELDAIIYEDIHTKDVFNMSDMTYSIPSQMYNTNPHLAESYDTVVNGLNTMKEATSSSDNITDTSVFPLKTWLNNTDNIDIAFQAKVAELTAQIRDYANIVKMNTDISRIDTDGIGKSVSRMVVINNKVNQIINGGVLNNFDDKISTDNPLGVFYNNLNKFTQALANNPLLFKEMDENSISVANEISYIASKTHIVNEELFDKVKNHMYSQMMTDFFNISREEASYLLTQFPLDFAEFKKDNPSTYRILEDLNVRSLDGVGTVKELIFKSNRTKSNLQEQVLIDSWAEMLEDEDAREVAEMMIKYSFLTTGFQMNSTQFYSLVPPSYFIENDINKFATEYQVPSSFIHKYIRMNHKDPLFKRSFKSKGKEEVVRRIDKYSVIVENNSDKIHDAYYYFDKKLHVVTGVSAEGLHLRQIPNLGYKIGDNTIPFYGEIYKAPELDNDNQRKEYQDSLSKTLILSKVTKSPYESDINYTLRQMSVSDLFSIVDFVTTEGVELTGVITDVSSSGYSVTVDKDSLYIVDPSMIVDMKEGELFKIDDVTAYAFKDTYYDINTRKEVPVKVEPKKIVRKSKNQKINIVKTQPQTTVSSVKDIISEYYNKLIKSGMSKVEINDLMWNTEFNEMSEEDVRNYLENCL